MQRNESGMVLALSLYQPLPVLAPIVDQYWYQLWRMWQSLQIYKPQT